MNILFIYEKPLQPEAGGTERITSLIISGLSSHNYNCIAMLVCDYNSRKMSYDAKPINDLYHFLKDKAIDVVINQIAYSTWLLEEFLKQGGARWKQEGGRIFSCLHFDPQNPSALFNAQISSHGTIKDYLNIAKTWLLYKRYEHKSNHSAAKTFEYIYTHSDKFIVLSKTHFKYMKSVWHRNDYSNLIAINNPLTFKDISPVSICAQKQHIVLVVARMSEFHKRISIILKTWKQLVKEGSAKAWTLKIIGDGPSLTEYKKYVRDNELVNITFLGQQNPEPYYAEASIFLMTSSAEGWGLTLTESLQRGVVPVVMNSSPVFSEIIENGKSGILVKNNDYKAFANAIRKLMKSEVTRITMSQNCLIQAKKFDLDNTINKWINELERNE